jgi:hypothetical protein
MLFPHNGKIFIIDQLTHHEPNQSGHIYNIMPLILLSVEFVPMIDVGPGLFQDPSLIGTYQGFPHPNLTIVVMFLVTVDGVEILDSAPSIENSLESTTTPSHTTQILLDKLPMQTPQDGTSDSATMGQIPIWQTVPHAITQISFF